MLNYIHSMQCMLCHSLLSLHCHACYLKIAKKKSATAFTRSTKPLRHLEFFSLMHFRSVVAFPDTPGTPHTAQREGVQHWLAVTLATINLLQCTGCTDAVVLLHIHVHAQQAEGCSLYCTTITTNLIEIYLPLVVDIIVQHY